MWDDKDGLKIQGYNLADDADSVLGPVTLNAASNSPTIDSAFSNRDDDGNLAFPGRYSGREEPAFRQPSETAPPPRENSSWPPKNDDGSYQLAPGAKLKFGTPSHQAATTSGRVLSAIGGLVAGGALIAHNPQLGRTAGAIIGANFPDLFTDIIEQGKYPHVEIGGGGSTSAISAQDYPNGNRMDD
ncbi:hypothetical protein [Fundidesulfovibrio putealis]|uniref:hypothetical protein n=1 Tax=Fundidesulfovibrio putealis TaxID=270496 RepID=UPI0012EB6D18|nr:hypothetical protein [Fundidesulfovibrio putealis]